MSRLDLKVTVKRATLSVPVRFLSMFLMFLCFYLQFIKPLNYMFIIHRSIVTTINVNVSPGGYAAQQADTSMGPSQPRGTEIWCGLCSEPCPLGQLPLSVHQLSYLLGTNTTRNKARGFL